MAESLAAVPPSGFVTKIRSVIKFESGVVVRRRDREDKNEITHCPSLASTSKGSKRMEAKESVEMVCKISCSLEVERTRVVGVPSSDL
jgi:hypothetical protein